MLLQNALLDADITCLWRNGNPAAIVSNRYLQNPHLQTLLQASARQQRAMGGMSRCRESVPSSLWSAPRMFGA